MGNLYQMDSSSAEVARLFKAMSGSAINAPTEIYSGYPGLVVYAPPSQTFSLVRRDSRACHSFIRL